MPPLNGKTPSADFGLEILVHQSNVQEDIQFYLRITYSLLLSIVNDMFYVQVSRLKRF